jgi:hypothetical protein
MGNYFLSKGTMYGLKLFLAIERQQKYVQCSFATVSQRTLNCRQSFFADTRSNVLRHLNR